MRQLATTTSVSVAVTFRDITESMGMCGRCHAQRCQQGCPLPYSYAAYPQQSDLSRTAKACYLSDSLCGLLSYLKRESIDLSGFEFVSLTNTAPEPVNARLYRIINGHWQA